MKSTFCGGKSENFRLRAEILCTVQPTSIFLPVAAPTRKVMVNSCASDKGEICCARVCEKQLILCRAVQPTARLNKMPGSTYGNFMTGQTTQGPNGIQADGSWSAVVSQGGLYIPEAGSQCFSGPGYMEDGYMVTCMRGSAAASSVGGYYRTSF
eukprot:g62710.t1